MANGHFFTQTADEGRFSVLDDSEARFDVAVLPNMQRPKALNFQQDEIRRTISTPPTDRGS